MKRNAVIKQLIALTVVFVLAACSPGNNIIGPRTEDAWKKWEEDQKALRETWGDTEVYAYIQTILDDLHNVNANVVFKDDFSTETESEELTALKKLCEDMHYRDEIPLDEFLSRLKNSDLRWVVGGMPDLDSIEDKGDGVYEVRLIYYPNADSMMAVTVNVRTEADGSFRLDFEK